MPSTQGAALDVMTGNISIAKYWLEKEAAKEALRLKSHWQYPPPGMPSVQLTSRIGANEKLIKTIAMEIISHSRGQTTPSLSIDQGPTVDIPIRDVFSEPSVAE